MLLSNRCACAGGLAPLNAASRRGSRGGFAGPCPSDAWLPSPASWRPSVPRLTPHSPNWYCCTSREALPHPVPWLDLRPASARDAEWHYSLLKRPLRAERPGPHSGGELLRLDESAGLGAWAWVASRWWADTTRTD